jgi:hypothetical protein
MIKKFGKENKMLKPALENKEEAPQDAEGDTSPQADRRRSNESSLRPKRADDAGGA